MRPSGRTQEPNAVMAAQRVTCMHKYYCCSANVYDTCTINLVDCYLLEPSLDSQESNTHIYPVCLFQGERRC